MVHGREEGLEGGLTFAFEASGGGCRLPPRQVLFTTRHRQLANILPELKTREERLTWVERDCGYSTSSQTLS